MTTEQRNWAASRPLHLTVVSTSRPRRCGIASYTADLVSALEAVAPNWRIDVCALDRDGFRYDSRVSVVIAEQERADYRQAADEIADRGGELVLIQHEYGIFGGADGQYLLDFTDRLVELGLPYVVTLHTVLSHPSANQDRVLHRMCAGAALVTVFTSTAREMVLADGVADPSRVVVAEHGAPAVLRAPLQSHIVGPAVAAMLQDVAGATLLCTFGLIGPSKGLEVALASLPALVARHPRLVYLIAGATHPEIVRHSGEEYRRSVAALARRLGVEDNVRFLDAFVTDDELASLLAHTDVYLTPYLSTEQSSSGTLTFALAAGCPVVSTDYQYAVNLLAPPPGGDAPGLLVPAADPAALSTAIARLLDDRDLLERTRRAADERGSTLTWPAVAELLASTLLPLAPSRRALRARAHPVVLEHLDRLVDGGGIVQFARADVPDLRSGYCVDDVARLGIVAASLCERRGRVGSTAREWMQMVLGFLDDAIVADSADGIHNLRRGDGSWDDAPHDGDHVGRAIWALGVIAGSRVPEPMRRRAEELLERALPLATGSPHLRSGAYSTLGLARSAGPFTRQSVTRETDKLAALRTIAHQLDAALAGGSAEWPWFEPALRYDNARLPQALIGAGAALGDAAMTRRGLDCLDWYLEQVGLVGDDPILVTVGNAWRAAGDPTTNEGDEQPLDAAAVVEALVDAWRLTRSPRYARLARCAFAWFDGANTAGLALYDPASGGCRDGLNPSHASINMGAESTLAYYQALFSLAEAGLVALPESPGRPTAERRGASVPRPGEHAAARDIARRSVSPAEADAPASPRRASGT